MGSEIAPLMRKPKPELRIVDLQVDGWRNPIGLDNPKPMLTWRYESATRGLDLTDGRCVIEYAEDAHTLERGSRQFRQYFDTDLDTMREAFYEGPKLGSRQRVYWRVRFSHPDLPAPAVSEIAFFEMGLLKASDWKAKWIAPSADTRERVGVCKDPVNRPPETLGSLMRYEFTLPDKPFQKARLYVTGLGYYEAYLNGRKVGNAVLEPSFTRFDKRVEYRTYDVADYLQPGVNCIGAILGQSWWEGPLCFLAQLEITYPDGERLTITTNPDWRWKPSPIRSNSIYKGEVYDARMEQLDWNHPHASLEGWEPVRIVAMPETMQLSAAFIEPIEVVATLLPVSITTPKPGARVFDLGQNISGWCRIQVRGQAGMKVILRHAELLYPDGTINPENLRSAEATDLYILKGEGLETYEPRFTYHGFRYVQVETDPPDAIENGALQLETLEGRLVHTAFEQRGHFACSNPLLNRIHEASVWGFRTNFHSIPTDCPQRDERQGWMGDAHIASLTGLYNFAAERAYRKFLRDIADELGEDGSLPDTVPHVWGSRPGDPMWTAAYPVIQHALLRFVGDYPEKNKHHRGIDKHIEFLANLIGEDGLLHLCHYGDWVAVEEGTPKSLVASCALMLVIQERYMSRRKAENQRRFDSPPIGFNWGLRMRLGEQPLWRNMAHQIREHFYHPEGGYFDGNTQTANLLPIYLGVFRENQEEEQRALAALTESIKTRYNEHLATGFVGTRYLLDMLTLNGYGDLAYKIATQTTYPSWGYMLENGATTIWELWKYETGPGMNSHNHPAFGCIDGWLYQFVAGIEPRLHEGLIRYLVNPIGDLQWAEASVRLRIGEASIRWERSDDRLVCQLKIPYGVQGNIFIYVKQPARLYEGSHLIHDGEHFVEEPDWFAHTTVHWRDFPPIALGVLPGEYEFVLTPFYRGKSLWESG